MTTKDERIAAAAKSLGIPETHLKALSRTYEEAKGEVPQDDREEAADAILWSLGDKRGYEPGGFTQTLLLAWKRADEDNIARLCIAFPILAVAFDILFNEGKDGLAKWAGLTSRDEEKS